MSRYVLTEPAASDLVDIAKFTAETWGASQACAYLDALETRLSLLAESPGLGRARPDLAVDMRSFPVESHVVFYVEAEEGVVVIRILHKSRDVERLMSPK